MSFRATIRKTEKGLLVAAADAELIGDRYEDDGVTLHVRETFYGDEPIEIETLVDALDGCFTANLVGPELIDALIAAGAVEEDEVKTVDGVPHVQLYRL